MKRSEIIDYIGTYLTKFVFGSLASYENTPVTSDLLDVDIPSWLNVNELINLPNRFVYNLPASSETPIIINFTDSTIKIGTASPVSIGADLSNYQAIPGITFELINADNDTITTPYSNLDPPKKQWADNTYISLVSASIQPNTDTGAPGGLTLDNINIIIKP